MVCRTRSLVTLNGTSDVKAEKIANISSAISIALYLVVISLLLSSLYLLMWSPSNGFKRMRQFLLTFTVLMFCISTLGIVTTLLFNFSRPADMLALYSATAYHEKLSGWWSPIRKVAHFCIAAAIWGADWFMIWRCMTLYQGASRPLRIVALVLCCIMLLLSLAIGLLYTVPIEIENLSLILFSTTTLSINIITTGLIVGRLLYHRHLLQQTFGEGHPSPYMRIVALFIESAALVVPFNIVLLVLAILPPDHAVISLIFVQMMVHVYVISPFLIISKVAYDRVYRPGTTCKTQDAQNVVDRDMRGLEFARTGTSHSTESTSEPSRFPHTEQLDHEAEG